MPYKDPEKQRQSAARRYKAKYDRDPEFREKEAARKAAWLADNEARKATMRRYSRKWRKDEGG
jgi:hypothetical protein